MTIPELLEKLFVNRSDVYAQAYLSKDKKRMSYAKKEGLIDKALIEEHINANITLGAYQLNGNCVKWGCADFDANTKEDFENAKKLYSKARELGFKPLLEMSGGGEFKCHIWFFCDSKTEAKDMKFFLEDLCEKAGIKPHEIFPKQLSSDKTLPYGNLVKLPLAFHLVTQKFSYFLNDFEPVINVEGIEELLQFHIDNPDIIPKTIIKEKTIKQYSSDEIKAKPTKYDGFFNFALTNELPSGKTAEGNEYQKITGVNDNILKNLAIWFFQKGYTLEQLEQEVKPIYDAKGWAFTDLKGWFKKAQKGEITEISKGELIQWCKTYSPQLLEFLKTPEEEKIKSFLIEDREKYESLGCGFHKGTYYFGTKLFKEGEPYVAVITSDKKCYINYSRSFKTKEGLKIVGKNEIRETFNLNYKDSFFDKGLDNLFSREAISKWLFGDSEDITLKSVYEELVSLFKKYIYFEDEKKYSLLACYRIASFFMPIWRARARLFLFAEMGSAKSRLTQMLHNTGFNSIALGDWTLPYLQRLIESTRGETHIDDYETLDEEKKNATTRLIKTGFMKGFKAGKISEGKNKEPETYDLFNTTTLNNTEGLDFISTDRTITIRIPKISKKEYEKEPNFLEPIWKELRDKLYLLGLKYPEQVAETYETITSEKIRGRLFFIIKPELTIARLISQKLYEELEDFWSEEIEQRQSIDFETDWEFLAYSKIYKLLSPLPLNQPYTLLSLLSPIEFKLSEDIIKPLSKELYSSLEEKDYSKKLKSMGIVVGNSLSRNPIFKKRILNGKKLYSFKQEEFLSLLEAKGFLKPIQEIKNEEKE